MHAKQASAKRIGNQQPGRNASIALLALASLVACGGRTTLLLSDTEDGGVADGGAGGRGGASSGGAGSGTSGAAAGGASGSLGGGGGAGALGRPLWRESRAPFCVEDPALVDRLDVWSDERGVYVLTAAAYAQHTIYFNGGGGWTPYFHIERELGLAELTGFRSGPLIEYGAANCIIQFIENGVQRCSGAAPWVQHIFAVNAALAYALSDDRLLRYDGLLWRQLGEPLVLPSGKALGHAVWADQTSVFVVGNAGFLSLSTNGVMKAIPRVEAPAVDYVSAWGFAANDLWAAGRDGQLVNYDGKSWSTALTQSGECSTILGMWGDSGTLYFHTSNMIGVRSDGGVRQLMSWPCGGPVTVQSLWGTSANEVFIALWDARAAAHDCAATLMWFDGKSFSAL